MRSLKRLESNSGMKLLVFDDQLQPLDIGREQRLFTAEQRITLAVLWGGCAVDGCDAPPSWTEAHHIKHWGRDHGKTNVGDGILLCKHHHLLFHNNGWEIERDPGGRYWLIPPETVDSNQRRILLQPKSRNMHDLTEARDAGQRDAGVRDVHVRDVQVRDTGGGAGWIRDAQENQAERLFAGTT
jgi:hypothetical protein